MTGLEKILKHIEDEAIANAEAILAEAKEKADKILANAKDEATKICADIAEKSKQDVQSCLSRAESAAALQEKKLILNAKQEVISDVIEKAKDSLLQLPEEEYFAVILKMVKKYALGQTGQIRFSPKDKKRIPEQFEKTILTELEGIKGASLTISDETANIDGGFILVYGDIEVNCSIDALFFAARESLQDKVCEVLFV